MTVIASPGITASRHVHHDPDRFTDDPTLPFSWTMRRASTTASRIQPRTVSRNAAATTGIFQQVYSYVHPFDKDDSDFPSRVCCSLCMEVYATPIRLPCCRQLICSTCVRRWQKQKPTCPWCIEPLEGKKMEVDRDVKKVVDDLDVYCAHRRQGCQWVGPRKYLLVHVAEECLVTRVLAGRTIQSRPETLFYLSLIDNPSSVQAAVKDLYPRASSIVASIIPARYRGRGRVRRSSLQHLAADIPPRTSSVGVNGISMVPPGRPVPFKRAGARGSVLVPMRSDSFGTTDDQHGGCVVEPVVGLDGNSREAEEGEEERDANPTASPPTPLSYFDSILASQSNENLEDEEHLSLSLYLEQQRRSWSVGDDSSMMPMGLSSEEESEEEDEIVKAKRAQLGASL
ncbi:hypothetical protein SpCBS45565_g02636 [Spizellomyces sp. 'palustris']|nr:hypothetical protein SpCBS45565_g02636 [Spizellomyces sp. 'palustris']